MSRQNLPTLLTIIFGITALLGLLFVPVVAGTLLDWAGFLAAIALLYGVVNLSIVHLRRLFRKGNLYSGLLLLAMAGVFIVAVGDSVGTTEGGLDTVFNVFLAPLEAAMASLLAIFLLLAGFRMLHRQRSWWTVLFMTTAIIVMLGSTQLPEAATALVGDLFGWLRDYIAIVFVTAGVRGILIGVALGTLTIGLRLIVGWERPYNQ